MSHWPSAKAKRVLTALLAIGWHVKRRVGSHRTMAREGWPVAVAFHDGEEIWPENARAPYLYKYPLVSPPPTVDWLTNPG